MGEGLTNALVEAQERLATTYSPDELATLGYDPLRLMQLPSRPGNSWSSFSLASDQSLYVSPNGRFRIMFVESATELGSYGQCEAWLSEIKKRINALRAAGKIPAQVRVDYTGRPAFVSEIAGGMQRDMFFSVSGTMVIIGLLFWWAHRRWFPLFWLLALLVLILGGTMALGGLVFGTLNVVSVGFAAILLGLAVDYGLVLYQEAQVNPGATMHALRQDIAPSIFWSALTTAGAFLMLNLGGLPGLAQLGTLVALGVGLAATIMLWAYLPPLLRGRRAVAPPPRALPRSVLDFFRTKLGTPPRVWAFTAGLLLAIGWLLVRDRPGFDHSAGALRPKNSPSYGTIEQIKTSLGQPEEPLWILAPGRDVNQVAQRLQATEAALKQAVSNQTIASFTLPVMLWPEPTNQAANLPLARKLVAHRSEWKAAALETGFTTNSLELTANMFDTWSRAARTSLPFWPTNQASRWVLDRFTSRTPEGFLALGFVYPQANTALEMEKLADWWPVGLREQGVILSGWELLGNSLFEQVKNNLPRVLWPMASLLLIALWLAFRRFREVALTVATLLFGGLILCGVMVLADWSWNLLNLMAIPLLLGAGVDYSIHMQLALRRHHGDIRAVRRSVGRALLVCGGTTAAAFGSLSFSNNAGMASLGQVCAVGLLCSMLTAVYLLPVWWKTLNPPKPDRH